MNSPAVIDTKSVHGRRELHFETFDDLLAEAEMLASSDVEVLGNWSLGQIMRHLARALDSSIDGSPFSFPAPVQWLMSLLMKKRFLTKSLSPGFKLPKKSGNLIPDATSTEEGLAELRAAVARVKTEPTRAPHGGFGKLTVEESDQFHLRHAEMHLSFAIPSPTRDT